MLATLGHRLFDLLGFNVQHCLLVAKPPQVFVDVGPDLLSGNLLFVRMKGEIADCMANRVHAPSPCK